MHSPDSLLPHLRPNGGKRIPAKHRYALRAVYGPALIDFALGLSEPLESDKRWGRMVGIPLPLSGSSLFSRVGKFSVQVSPSKGLIGKVFCRKDLEWPISVRDQELCRRLKPAQRTHRASVRRAEAWLYPEAERTDAAIQTGIPDVPLRRCFTRVCRMPGAVRTWERSGGGRHTPPDVVLAPNSGYELAMCGARRKKRLTKLW